MTAAKTAGTTPAAHTVPSDTTGPEYRGGATPAPRIGPVRALRHAATLVWRAMVKTRRNPEQLGDLVVQPIVFLVLFVYVFGGAIAQSTRAYLQFALPGLLVQTAMFASMGLGLSLNADIGTGVFDRFRSLPIARSAPLVGAVLADLVRYLVSMLVLLGIGAALGFRITTGPLAAVAAFALVLAFTAAVSWIAVLVGLVAKAPQSVHAYGFGVMFPLTFGSNVLVPTGTMPGWLQTWVRVNPVSQLSTAARGLLVGGPVSHAAVWCLLWAAGIVLVFAPLAVRAYRRRL